MTRPKHTQAQGKQRSPTLALRRVTTRAHTVAHEKAPAEAGASSSNRACAQLRDRLNRCDGGPDSEKLIVATIASVVFTEIDFETLDENAMRRIFVGATRASLKLVMVVSERAAALFLKRLEDAGDEQKIQLNQ